MCVAKEVEKVAPNEEVEAKSLDDDNAASPPPPPPPPLLLLLLWLYTDTCRSTPLAKRAEVIFPANGEKGDCK
jgi:hypothetical protein